MSNYEEKMKALSEVRPEKKDLLLARILKGERKVNITGDEDLFFQVNKDRVSMDEFTDRDKFKHAARAVKEAKKGMYDPTHGKSKDKKLRWLGDIPAEIYFARPEFSPLLPREERNRNIKKFLNEYNAFRAGDRKL